VQEIIREILTGNQDRFREIVKTHGDDLLRVAYHFVRNWDDARELTQITFLRCFENLRRYDPQRPFAPWLYRIHVNVCKSHARRLRRHISLAEGAVALTTPSLAESGIDESEIILKQIALLPLKQKTAFILIEIEGQSSVEAAFIMGCKDSTARVHLARAKENLRQKLSQMGIGNDNVL
jgi:RNA polymerase sigma-70 factor (ECF subfamily)